MPSIPIGITIVVLSIALISIFYFFLKYHVSDHKSQVAAFRDIVKRRLAKHLYLQRKRNVDIDDPVKWVEKYWGEYSHTSKHAFLLNESDFRDVVDMAYLETVKQNDG